MLVLILFTIVSSLFSSNTADHKLDSSVNMDDTSDLVDNNRLALQKCSKRPGMCPIGTTGICTETCSNDFNCQKGSKCCSNGCGYVCKKACFPATCRCLYGIEWSFDNTGCKVCRCKSNPCVRVDCSTGTVCKVIEGQAGCVKTDLSEITKEQRSKPTCCPTCLCMTLPPP